MRLLAKTLCGDRMKFDILGWFTKWLVKTPKTKSALKLNVTQENAEESLLLILESVKELVLLEGNDFLFSGWNDADAAEKMLDHLINKLKTEYGLKELEFGVIFAPTGSLCEVAMSSGWDDMYVLLGSKYDQAARYLWGNSC